MIPLQILDTVAFSKKKNICELNCSTIKIAVAVSDLSSILHMISWFA